MTDKNPPKVREVKSLEELLQALAEDGASPDDLEKVKAVLESNSTAKRERATSALERIVDIALELTIHPTIAPLEQRRDLLQQAVRVGGALLVNGILHDLSEHRDCCGYEKAIAQAGLKTVDVIERDFNRLRLFIEALPGYEDFKKRFETGGHNAPTTH